MGECNAMAEWASIRTAVVSIAWVILTAGATTFVAANPATLIKLIVPNAPGGGIDFAARLLAQEVGQTKQITIIVENRPGAGGVIGAEDVAHAAPDGNTLLLDAGNLIVNSQVRTVHYDPLVSFAPICNLIAAPNLIVVSGTSPFRTLADFINEARAKPGAVTLASNGPGTALQIEFEKLKRAANVDIGFISYRGTTPAVEAVLGGHVTSAIVSYSVAAEQLKTGALRALAAGTRIQTLPNLPTLAEVGYGVAAYEGWEGLFAPAGTPQQKLSELANWFTAATRTPEIKAKLADQGLFPAGTCGADFIAFLKTEYEETGRVIREAGIKAQ
jgi:tripartite-type tricarboxylate transporter receptor subunit TctC